MKSVAIWTLNIPNNGIPYLPKLCEITHKSISEYAQRIGADFNIITQRKFPAWPVTYEKMQLYELGTEYEDNLLVDSDLLIREDFPDFRNIIPKQNIGLYTAFDADKFYAPDKYFLRDGRKIGCSATMIYSSDFTHDIWTPLEISFEEARSNIKFDYNIDEYCISRNLARFGLKISGLFSDPDMIYHLDATTATLDKSIRTDNSEDKLVKLALNKLGDWENARTNNIAN